VWREHGRGEVRHGALNVAGARFRSRRRALVQRALQNRDVLTVFRNNRCGRVE